MPERRQQVAGDHFPLLQSSGRELVKGPVQLKQKHGQQCYVEQSLHNPVTLLLLPPLHLHVSIFQHVEQFFYTPAPSRLIDNPPQISGDLLLRLLHLRVAVISRAGAEQLLFKEFIRLLVTLNVGNDVGVAQTNVLSIEASRIR